MADVDGWPAPRDLYVTARTDPVFEIDLTADAAGTPADLTGYNVAATVTGRDAVEHALTAELDGATLRLTLTQAEIASFGPDPKWSAFLIEPGGRVLPGLAGSVRVAGL
ncbi:MAG: hypothetical protein AAGD13_00730 [Pseudomonadota bacterium]